MSYNFFISGVAQVLLMLKKMVLNTGLSKRLQPFFLRS